MNASGARARVVSQLNAMGELRAALRELHTVCKNMDLDNQAQRPTETAYQAAMSRAEQALATHSEVFNPAER